ncbi:lysophospholipid acyltransferase family protein [Cribrihabitans neustonicus]|uniref:lysophospholipid acyltransferase family protein n=1 Tax=Cribrihabitans neustonicus TaxID=1429085 RepID=UPI003B5A5EBB
MTMSWQSSEAPDPVRIGVAGWGRALLRGLLLGTLVFGSLAVLLLLRLLERPLFGLRRPLTPFLTQTVCRGALAILGLSCLSRGQIMRQPGAVVANHASWLDIFVLNAQKRVYFVSKAEVAGWPGIGWLARATGTVFIERDRQKARAQTELFAKRLAAGHKLLFFPEGTSTDGLRILPFKTTLFAPFFNDGLRHGSHIQPVTLRYTAPAGAPPRFYGWWGDMDFGPHLLKVLSAPRQGVVEVMWHAPLNVSEFPDRKALAAKAFATVKAGGFWEDNS